MRLCCVLLLLALCGSAAKKPPRTLTEDEMRVAYAAACERLSQMLRAPATAQYAPIEETKFSPAWRNMIDVRLWVDAQNGFGALIRTRFTCSVGPEKANGRYVHCRKGIFEP